VPGIRYKDQMSRAPREFRVVDANGNVLRTGGQHDTETYLNAHNALFPGNKAQLEPVETRNIVLFADELAKILARE
jgi:hypothetical protein